MSDILNKPTMFIKGVATEPSRAQSPHSPAPGGAERSPQRPAPGGVERSSSGLPAKSAPAPDAKLGSDSAPPLGNRTPSLTATTARRQPRSVRRAQVLQTIASGPATVAPIIVQSPATSGSVPVVSTQWQTISHYLRRYFLGRPVCVLTQSGRVTGQLLEVTTSDIALANSDGQTKRLAFSAILSVGHLA